MSLLEDLKRIQSEWEEKYPRKTTPNSFRWSRKTMDFVKLLIPVHSGDPDKNPLVPLFPLNGMRFEIDDNIPDLDVEVLNQDGERIEVIHINA